MAVGGGSILLPDELAGFGAVHRPENFAVANAVGAAIAQVSGELDRVYSVSEVVRDLWRRDQDSGVSAGEKRMLLKARQVLISELALAQKSTDEEASAVLDEVLAAVTV